MKKGAEQGDLFFGCLHLTCFHRFPRAKTKPRALIGEAHKMRPEQSNLEAMGGCLGDRIMLYPEPLLFFSHNGSSHRVQSQKMDKICINMIA